MQQIETQQVTEITETGKLPFGGSLVKGQQWASVDVSVLSVVKNFASLRLCVRQERKE